MGLLKFNTYDEDVYRGGVRQKGDQEFVAATQFLSNDEGN